MGGAANKNDRKFLDFAPRELVERGRGASVIRQNPADFVRNTFKLHFYQLAEGGGFEPPCLLAQNAWFSRPAQYDHFGIPPR